MLAQVGSWIVVHGRTLDAPVREGRIDGLLHADGSPPYLIHWLDDDRRSVVFPGADATITAERPHAPRTSRVARSPLPGRTGLPGRAAAAVPSSSPSQDEDA